MTSRYFMLFYRILVRICTSGMCNFDQAIFETTTYCKKTPLTRRLAPQHPLLHHGGGHRHAVKGDLVTPGHLAGHTATNQVTGLPQRRVQEQIVVLFLHRRRRRRMRWRRRFPRPSDQNFYPALRVIRSLFLLPFRGHF